MIPYELDPSLHAAPPAPERFDDGFAPPPPDPLPGAAEPGPGLAPLPDERVATRGPAAAAQASP